MTPKHNEALIRALENESSLDREKAREIIAKSTETRFDADEYRAVKKLVTDLPKLPPDDTAANRFVAYALEKNKKRSIVVERIEKRVLPFAALAAALAAGVMSFYTLKIDAPDPIAGYLLSDASELDVVAYTTDPLSYFE